MKTYYMNMAIWNLFTLTFRHWKPPKIITNHPYEDLAKFGYKAEIKRGFQSPKVRVKQVLNRQVHTISFPLCTLFLEFLIFNFAFWRSFASKKKRKEKHWCPISVLAGWQQTGFKASSSLLLLPTSLGLALYSWGLEAGCQTLQTKLIVPVNFFGPAKHRTFFNCHESLNASMWRTVHVG
jgi:hypothetical protein